MKYMIASDIHGSAYYCSQLLDALRREGDCRLLLLGDLLYHGPRNDLPRDYAPKEVIRMLSGIQERVFCVRVNRTERDNCFAFNGFCKIVYRRLLGGVGGNAQNDGDVHAVLLHQFF